MGRYGVLLIGGLRTHAEFHGPSFAADPRCRIIAVADEQDVSEYRAGLNRLFAHQMGVPYIDDLDHALAREDVHIVSMCADVERRARVGVKCVSAGKHVYFDKPLAGSVADANAIADAVERAGVVTQVGTMIHTTWARAAKEALQQNAVGTLLGIHADMLLAKGKPGTVPALEARQESAAPDRYTFVDSKRELFDMGLYPISAVNWITGKRVKSVFGVTGNYFFAEHAANGTEDFGVPRLSSWRDVC